MTRIAAAALLVALGGCTSFVSRDISDDGTTAQEVVFPSIEQDAWLKEGIFPNLDNLRNVAPGLSKNQLYDLLGRPHFSEGLAGVREWDWVLNFRTPQGVKVCQYKALFDKNYLAQSYYWKPADCADLLKTAAPAAVVEAAPKRMTLSADALFAFDKSGLSDLRAKGRTELDALAAQLKGTDVERVDVAGYTDRLGSSAYNQKLSDARARTVRDYLVRGGVPAARVTAVGHGASDPVVQCNERERQALIACLAPNRRVEISVRAGAK